MTRHIRLVYLVLIGGLLWWGPPGFGQTAAGQGPQTPTAISAQEAAHSQAMPNALTWEQLKAKFEASNPQREGGSVGG